MKNTVREILGDLPSQTFLSRIDDVLDNGCSDKESLTKACARVRSMVDLFIGTDEARVIASRCREVLEKLN
ncbi:MAG: hypothetical protein ABSG42_04235 [Nitrospirota bacterium]